MYARTFCLSFIITENKWNRYEIALKNCNQLKNLFFFLLLSNSFLLEIYQNNIYTSSLYLSSSNYIPRTFHDSINLDSFHMLYQSQNPPQLYTFWKMHCQVLWQVQTVVVLINSLGQIIYLLSIIDNIERNALELFDAMNGRFLHQLL